MKAGRPGIKLLAHLTREDERTIRKEKEMHSN
jgi:hypothetical protein